MFGGGGGGGGSSETENHRNRMNLISPSLPFHMNQSTISTEIQSASSKKDERVPQWSQQETKDFIMIRAELERDFTTTKRNKTLWEIVAMKMKDRGYKRSPDQCKCKWKNLVNRYKGKETADPETGRHCPFFDELHAIFTERAQNMQRLLLESEAGGIQAKKKVKRLIGDRSSEDFSDDDLDGEDDSEEEQTPRRSRKRKIVDRHQRSSTSSKPSSANSGIKEILHEFFQQQQMIDMQWREVMEKRAQERLMFEQEWRQSMEDLERERLLAEKAWQEREEQRRIREESRAEKRDALLTMLLNKLIQGENRTEGR